MYGTIVRYGTHAPWRQGIFRHLVNRARTLNQGGIFTGHFCESSCQPVTSIATEGSHQIFQPMISAWKITIKVKLRAPARHIMSCLLQRLNDVFWGVWWRLKSYFLVFDKVLACPIFSHVQFVLRDQSSGGARWRREKTLRHENQYRTFGYRYIYQHELSGIPAV